jgi:hypothetical protein
LLVAVLLGVAHQLHKRLELWAAQVVVAVLILILVVLVL